MADTLEYENYLEETYVDSQTYESEEPVYNEYCGESYEESYKVDENGYYNNENEYYNNENEYYNNENEYYNNENEYYNDENEHNETRMEEERLRIEREEEERKQREEQEKLERATLILQSYIRSVLERRLFKQIWGSRYLDAMKTPTTENLSHLNREKPVSSGRRPPSRGHHRKIVSKNIEEPPTEDDGGCKIINTGGAAVITFDPTKVALRKTETPQPAPIHEPVSELAYIQLNKSDNKVTPEHRESPLVRMTAPPQRRQLPGDSPVTIQPVSLNPNLHSNSAPVLPARPLIRDNGPPLVPRYTVSQHQDIPVPLPPRDYRSHPSKSPLAQSDIQPSVVPLRLPPRTRLATMPASSLHIQALADEPEIAPIPEQIQKWDTKKRTIGGILSSFFRRRPKQEELVKSGILQTDIVLSTADNCATCNSKLKRRKNRQNCQGCGAALCKKCSRRKKALPALGFQKPVIVCSVCVENL